MLLSMATTKHTRNQKEARNQSEPLCFLSEYCGQSGFAFLPLFCCCQFLELGPTADERPMPDEAVTFVDFEPDEAVLAESGETLFDVGDVGLIPAETTGVVFAVSIQYGFHDNHLFILIIPHVSSDKWRADAEKLWGIGAELGRLSLALTPPLRHAFAWGRGGREDGQTETRAPNATAEV